MENEVGSMGEMINFAGQSIRDTLSSGMHREARQASRG
jgi:hypothetical protein